MDTYQGNEQAPSTLHKYVYCQVDPIGGIDPSGNDDLASILDVFSMFDTLSSIGTTAARVLTKLQTHTLYVRSFAPWATFGGGFSGDNRGFTTVHDNSVTSRITGIVKFHLAPVTITSATAYSDPSHHPLRGTATGSPRIAATVSGIKMNVKLAGANPLVPHAPDIDVKLDMAVDATLYQTVYRGNLYGDAFPNAEVFVVDSKDRATMLHTFTTSGGRETGPVELLPGDNNRPMGPWFQTSVSE
jgi:hypothetical protein